MLKARARQSSHADASGSKAAVENAPEESMRELQLQVGMLFGGIYQLCLDNCTTLDHILL